MYAVAMVGLAATGLRLEALPPAIALYSTALLAVLLLVFSGGGVLDRPAVLLGGAVLVRALFLWTVPDLSVDPYRYLWDGWLSADGINPYRHTPSDPLLVERHGDPLFGAMNSRDFYSIYPPLSQWLFLPAGLLYERIGWPAAFIVLKATMTLVELAGLVFLFRAVRRLAGRGGALHPRHLALYAWNPLVVVAVAGVGHSEGGLVLALGIFVLGLVRAAPAAAWAGLGLAAASKGIPLVLAPLLFRHHRMRWGLRTTLTRAGLGLAPAALLSLPFLFPGLPQRALASADLYVRLFEFNAGLFAVLRHVVGWVAPGDPGAALGPLLRGTFLAAAAVVWVRHPAQRAADVLRAAPLLFGLYLVTATTVHPWYLLWALPFVAFTGRLRAPWLWASWAAFPTYLAYIGVPEGALAGVFWGGVLVLLVPLGGPWARRVLLPLAGRRKARQVRPYVRGESLLDLGSGEGFVGRHLVDARRRVLLADVDPFFRVELPRFVYDGRRLPLPSGSVDTVLLSLVLHHAEDPEAVLREALRVARTRVVVTESTYEHTWERRVLEWADRSVNRARGGGRMGRGEGPLHFHTPQAWSRIAEGAGGKVVLSRRLNRLGHRHHLLVVEPRPAGKMVAPREGSPEGPRDESERVAKSSE